MIKGVDVAGFAVRLRALEPRLAHTMLRDRRQIFDRYHGLMKRAERGLADEAGLARLRDHLARSAAALDRRRAALPAISYPADLPIVEHRQMIAEAITEHQVIIICGETGSGKTTQLAKICMELGRGIAGLIGHTQPRRIAARTVASRISQELGTPLGQAVGYKVRFGDHTSPESFIKVMTDGILLAETQSDRLFEQYDTLIIDEAHERSLNIDFILGYLKQILPRRPDLKVIVTSATIDPERFSAHFNQAPIVRVSGRTYPVEVLYRPLRPGEADQDEMEQIEGILQAVDELSRRGPGDILVFLAGERDIQETAEALRGVASQSQVLPLFARLSLEEQNRVFHPHGGRRIVLATNVAETSLTVPGIRYVIDPGTARLSRYSPKNKVQRLLVEPISQASADQRKGRCGRVGPGTCIRLYSEADYASRPAFTDPEIVRTNLAGVILQMAALKIGTPETFDFIQPPDRRLVRDGYHTLHELGAVDVDRNLTDLGRDMARLPVEPRVARMLIAARQDGCLNEVLVIAAALSVPDPRERPADQQATADAAHRRFTDDQSDFMTFLNIWNFYRSLQTKVSRNQVKKACRASFLSYNRLREWSEVHRQLKLLISETTSFKRFRTQKERGRN